MDHNFEKLKKHILALSDSKDFEFAKKEWDITGFVIEEWDECPCGQSIKEQCYITNRRTGNETYVGNVCINKFMGMDIENVVEGLKRIKKDPYSNANKSVVFYAKSKGYLNEKESAFLLDTARKRSLTRKQLDWKKALNEKILNAITATRTIVEVTPQDIDPTPAAQVRRAFRPPGIR